MKNDVESSAVVVPDVSTETSPLLSNELNSLERNGPSTRLRVWTCKLTKRGIISGTLLVILVSVILFAFYLAKFGPNHHGHDFTVHRQLERVDVSRIVDNHWQMDHAIPETNEITLTLAVKQSNLNEMTDRLNQQSNPLNSMFGKHLLSEDVHAMIKPSEDSLAIIGSWLEQYGIGRDDIESVTPSGDFLRFTTTIEVANEMLNCEYWSWKNLKNENAPNHVRVKSDYSVPTVVAEHLDFISPTLRFPPVSHTHKTEKLHDLDPIKPIAFDPKDYGDYVFPAKLWQLYHMVDHQGEPVALQSEEVENYQVVASFLKQWYNDRDLETFWDTFGVEPSNIERIPKDQPQGDGTEAELDTQYLTASGQGIDTLVWDIEDDLYFISLLQQITDSNYRVSVVSMSYGGDEQANGIAYCTRASYEFAKMSLMGITFFASSGDSGAVDDRGMCDNDGRYTPSFPASSPYVVAIGGTVEGAVTKSCDHDTQESAWVLSGGGFSVYLDQFDFQSDVIESYLNQAQRTPKEERFDKTKSAYPDMAAQSDNYLIVYSGALYAVGGTSASCPVVAGMFALINDVRLKNGLPRLGWINRMIYDLGTSDQNRYFNDVVKGHNIGALSDQGRLGYEAAKGWDPVTGWGTPKFERLFDYFANLKHADNEYDESDVQMPVEEDPADPQNEGQGDRQGQGNGGQGGQNRGNGN